MCTTKLVYKSTFKSLVNLGRTSLSLAQGNMVVARQLLLIFNFHICLVLCSLSIKTTVMQKTIFLRPVDAIILCVNDVL